MPLEKVVNISCLTLVACEICSPVVHDTPILSSRIRPLNESSHLLGPRGRRPQRAPSGARTVRRAQVQTCCSRLAALVAGETPAVPAGCSTPEQEVATEGDRACAFHKNTGLGKTCCGSNCRLMRRPSSRAPFSEPSELCSSGIVLSTMSVPPAVRTAMRSAS